MGTTVITNKVRFCFAHVFEPYAKDQNDKKKYSVCILFPKDEQKVGGKLTTYEKCQAAIKEALEEGKVRKFQGKIPLNAKTPIHDGDKERPDDPAFKGMYYINAKSDIKPEIVDKNNEMLISNSEMYSGVYGRASINFYAFDKGVNKGVAAGLRNLQTYNEGESMVGGTRSAAADFSDEDDDLL